MSDQFKLSKTYEPGQIEEEVADKWLASDAFHAVPDERPPERRYVIMMPLPNVTGALHMGHAMDNVMQDILIRLHRMMGDNTLWMPGTDHAGIATQAVVEKRLKELEGKTRHDIGRESLVKKIWDWKDQYGTRIVKQQQRMGCSADWKRQRFTMDKICSRSVRHTFFRMFMDGLIFRGKRLVNWDPFLRTSISDDEVYHETVQGHFWHLQYTVMDPQEGDPERIVVATTRPETMLGDTAVAVHPTPDEALEAEIEYLEELMPKAPEKDRSALQDSLDSLKKRKTEMLPELLHLRDMAKANRKVLLPLMDRPIPLILDEWAKPSLGSGCVKITPAHDPNDYEVWQRHKDEIDIINILNPDGTLNENAGEYEGLDRYEARDRVVEDLNAKGLLGPVEDRVIEIGHSDRSKTPIEPYLSDQWFVKMGDIKDGIVMGRGTSKEHKSEGLVQAAMDAVTDGRVKFHPDRFVKTYLDWLSEKRDWPISRQLWWGHRIPVWSKEITMEKTSDTIEALIEIHHSEITTKESVVRLVRKEDGASVLLPIQEREKCLNVMRRFTDEESSQDQVLGGWLIDVCLLQDHKATIKKLEDAGLERDPDVLDTWFSSALWPHSTLGWPDPETAETEGGATLGSINGNPNCLDYYYPGSCLVTARDIITLWVARMVLAGLYNIGDVPFTDVFIHANILDGKGERMSKSKGNGIDPVDIIEEYGTDAMRYVLSDMQTGNQDIRLPVTAVCPSCNENNDLAELKHGRSVFTYLCGHCSTEFDVLGTMPNLPAAKLISERFMDGKRFCNKLWNTARFALGNLHSVECSNLEQNKLELEDRWILAAMNQAIRKVDAGFAAYNPSQALGAAREFMWGDLCDWYLEIIKPRLAKEEDSTAAIAKQILAHCLDTTLRLLHPFVPFITEHLYGQLQKTAPKRGLPGLIVHEKSHSTLLVKAPWPKPQPALDDETLMKSFATIQNATSGVRELRSDRQISPRDPVIVTLKPGEDFGENLETHAHIIKTLANVEKLFVDPKANRPPGSASTIVGNLQIFIHDVVDDTAEKERLEKNLKDIEKEIAICDKKLGNEKFVSRAPAKVVEEQKKRKEKYEGQREAVKKALKDLA